MNTLFFYAKSNHKIVYMLLELLTLSCNKPVNHFFTYINRTLSLTGRTFTVHNGYIPFCNVRRLNFLNDQFRRWLGRTFEYRRYQFELVYFSCDGSLSKLFYTVSINIYWHCYSSKTMVESFQVLWMTVKNQFSFQIAFRLQHHILFYNVS